MELRSLHELVYYEIIWHYNSTVNQVCHTYIYFTLAMWKKTCGFIRKTTKFKMNVKSEQRVNREQDAAQRACWGSGQGDSLLCVSRLRRHPLTGGSTLWPPVWHPLWNLHVAKSALQKAGRPISHAYQSYIIFVELLISIHYTFSSVFSSVASSKLLHLNAFSSHKKG